MPRIPPLAEADAPEKVVQTWGRVREMLETDTLPGPFLIYGRNPAFLQDFYMNFKRFVYSDGKLDARTRAVLGLAVSLHGGSGVWADFFTDRLKQLGGDDQQVADIAALVATNAMYNAFFKFRDIAGSDIFEGLSVGLRAHTFAGTGFDEQTVELINIVISDINACKPCTSGHVSKARQLGLADEAILEAVQCAATMLAGVQFLRATE